MKLEAIYHEIETFSLETHGSTDFYKDEIYVMGGEGKDFAPYTYLQKKVENLNGLSQLLKEGFVLDSYDLYEIPFFKEWFEHQFSRKLKRSMAKQISILYQPKNKEIFYIPNPADQSFENLEVYNNKNPKSDVFFAMSHGVHRGIRQARGRFVF